MAQYKRVLLKLSGEALAGEQGTGFDEATCIPVAKQIKKLVDDGVEVAIVIGGGNFWRGRSSETIDRTKADQIGMMATVMNCIYMSEICRFVGLSTQVLTPFQCGSFTKLFSKDRVNKYLKKGIVTFFAGGTGHPYFSTDTATALRAIEIEADIILAAKSIDGVYDSDPAINPDAKKYDTMKMSDIVDNKLGVVDLAAAVLCMENKMPMCVFGLNEENSIINTVSGKCTGTIITV
ncbi:MAG: UMP kinase [Eubacterium sp.]|nr:UMP kinase [Eubacterium sp.]